MDFQNYNDWVVLQFIHWFLNLKGPSIGRLECWGDLINEELGAYCVSVGELG